MTIECLAQSAMSMEMQALRKNPVGLNQSEQLFPMLPNEITTCHIVPKLSWRFQNSAAVSPAWRQVICCCVSEMQGHNPSQLSRLFLTGKLIWLSKIEENRDCVPWRINSATTFLQSEDTTWNFSELWVRFPGWQFDVMGGAEDSCEKWNAEVESSSKVYVIDLANAWSSTTPMRSFYQTTSLDATERTLGTH
jgi:hypothetical protein